MGKTSFLNSSSRTIGIVLLFGIISYVFLVFLGVNFFSCNQKGTGKIDFNMLFDCVNSIVIFTLVYLLSAIGLLIFFMKRKILNYKGVCFCMIFFSVLALYITITERNTFGFTF